MITNLFFFAAFVALAYLTTSLSTRQPQRARLPVRSVLPDDVRRQ